MKRLQCFFITKRMNVTRCKNIYILFLPGRFLSALHQNQLKMKQTDIIRLGIIAIALIFAYHGITYVIGFVEFLFEMALSEGRVPGKGIGGFFLKMACFFVAALLLIKNSRRMAIFIDGQK
jgi:hypothetical protein